MRLLMRALTAAAAVGGLLALATPANATLAFSSSRCDQGGVRQWGPQPAGDQPACRSSIFRLADDGSGLTRLTTGASSSDEGLRPMLSGDFSPAFSPDGARIAFSRQTAEGWGYFRIFTMRADGSDQRQLVSPPPADIVDAGSPAWSPDGTRIAFQGAVDDKPGEPAIYTVDSAGHDLERVSPGGLAARAPTFTADGKRIVFVALHGTLSDGRDVRQTDYAAWSTKLDGSDLVRLTMGDVLPAAEGLSFSPDGRYVALTLFDGGLYTMRPDGSELKRRTNHFGFHPAWSADGSTLFYSGPPTDDPQEPRTALYRQDLGGGKRQRLLDPAGTDLDPTWSAAEGFSGISGASDRAAPAVLLGSQLGERAKTSQKRADKPAAKRPPVPRSRIPFIALDRSGIRKLKVSVALRVHGGCRFLKGSHLSKATSDCGRARFVRFRGAAWWAKRTSKLRDGTYVLRFAARDYRGNATKRPRPRLVRVR